MLLMQDTEKTGCDSNVTHFLRFYLFIFAGNVLMTNTIENDNRSQIAFLKVGMKLKFIQSIF